MSYRLAGTNDLIAYEGKYHLKCYAKFQRTAVEQQPTRQEKENCFVFEEVMSVLQSGVSKGNVYSLKSFGHIFVKDIIQRMELVQRLSKVTGLRPKLRIILEIK